MSALLSLTSTHRNIIDIPKIAFEGIDCSYKETNSKKLKEYLESIGYKIIYQSFPRYGNESAYIVNSYLHNKYNGFLNRTDISIMKRSELIFDFYMIDMFDWEQELYKKLQDEDLSNTIIILDRYYLSGIYHLNQEAILLYSQGKYNIEKLQDMGYKNAIEKFKLFKCDTIFKMISDPKLIREKAIERGDLDRNEENSGYLYNCKKIFDNLSFDKYLDMSKPYSGTFTIDTIDKNKDDVFKQIMDTKVVKYFEKNRR